jgi:hypothetical protein
MARRLRSTSDCNNDDGARREAAITLTVRPRAFEKTFSGKTSE